MSEDKAKDSEAKKSSAPKKTAAKTAPAPAPTPVVVERKEKLYSFEQWASMRGIPAHHRPGMKAFVKQAHKNRTMGAWDRCLADY